MVIRRVSLIMLLLVLGSCDSTSNLPTPAIIKSDGQDFEFPAQIIYGGETWNRVRTRPSEKLMANGCSCFYRCHAREDRMLYLFLGGADTSTDWIYRIYHKASDDLLFMDTLSVLYRDKKGIGMEVECINGFPDGPRSVYYANGVTKFVGKTFFGSKEGRCVGFYPDGTLWWKCEFESGEITPKGLKSSVFYHEDGAVNADVDTCDKAIKELERWHRLRSQESADSREEFVRRVENSRKSLNFVELQVVGPSGF